MALRGRQKRNIILMFQSMKPAKIALAKNLLKAVGYTDNDADEWCRRVITKEQEKIKHSYLKKKKEWKQEQEMLVNQGMLIHGLFHELLQKEANKFKIVNNEEE